MRPQWWLLWILLVLRAEQSWRTSLKLMHTNTIHRHSIRLMQRSGPNWFSALNFLWLQSIMQPSIQVFQLLNQAHSAVSFCESDFPTEHVWIINWASRNSMNQHAHTHAHALTHTRKKRVNVHTWRYQEISLRSAKEEMPTHATGMCTRLTITLVLVCVCCPLVCVCVWHCVMCAYV